MQEVIRLRVRVRVRVRMSGLATRVGMDLRDWMGRLQLVLRCLVKWSGGVTVHEIFTWNGGVRRRMMRGRKGHLGIWRC